MPTTTATPRPAAAVIPLQPAARDLPRRPDSHAAPLPPYSDAAWWDAETEAMWAPLRPADQHGRRCACRPVEQPVEDAS